MAKILYTPAFFRTSGTVDVMVLEIEMFSKKFSYLKTAVVAFVAVIDNVMMSPGVTPPKAVRNMSGLGQANCGGWDVHCLPLEG